MDCSFICSDMDATLVCWTTQAKLLIFRLIYIPTYLVIHMAFLQSVAGLFPKYKIWVEKKSLKHLQVAYRIVWDKVAFSRCTKSWTWRKKSVLIAFINGLMLTALYGYAYISFGQ